MPVTQAPALSRRQTLGGLASALFAGFSQATAQDSNPGKVEQESIRQVYSAPPGPWGKISYYHFYLEAPEQLLSHVPPPSTQTRWIVPQTESPRLEALFVSAGLTEAQRNILLNPKRLVINNGLFVLFPDPSVVLDLTPEARAVIYGYLSRFQQNAYHAYPVYIFSGSLDEWAQDADIRPEILDIMRHLTYQRGDLMVFSDVAIILAMSVSENEAKHLVKKFSRVRTMIASVGLDEDTDVAALIDYWSTGLGLRRKDVEPLIRSVAMTRGVRSLDLLHLLPPLPRKLLYTYPDVDMAMDGRFPDCHWTSLNFFKYTPQSFYLNERLATSAVLENFKKVQPPYQYGDVLIFMTENAEAHHSCTYLAADLVFTKNGRNILIPWTVAKLSEIQGIYKESDGHTLEIQAFRPKSVPT